MLSSKRKNKGMFARPFYRREFGLGAITIQHGNSIGKNNLQTGKNKQLSSSLVI
jgi:hypothetical protein